MRDGRVNLGYNNELEYYFYGRYDLRETLTLYYVAIGNYFYDNKGPIFNIYEILEPWKVRLFKEKGPIVFPDRTNSFLVELEWLPF